MPNGSKMNQNLIKREYLPIVHFHLKSKKRKSGDSHGSALLFNEERIGWCSVCNRSTSQWRELGLTYFTCSSCGELVFSEKEKI